MALLYSNPCYNEVWFKRTALYHGDNVYCRERGMNGNSEHPRSSKVV